MADLINDKLRYGISALDLEHRDYATNDELLVHGQDGKIYYKRPDGQIVSYDNNDYTKETLINATKTALSISPVNINPSESDYLVYHTINISGTNNILSDNSHTVPDNSFHISPNEHGFFIRVRGNGATNTCMEYMEYSDTSSGMVTVTYRITTGGVSEDHTIDVVFNKLTLIPISNSNMTTTVTIVSINFSKVNSVYNSYDYATKNNLVALNLNEKFEADSIDVVTYIDDVTRIDISSTELIKFQNVVSIETINTEYSGSEAFIISKDKPTYKCIWGKILD